jgi:hypothetical protein
MLVRMLIQGYVDEALIVQIEALVPGKLLGCALAAIVLTGVPGDEAAAGVRWG